MRFGSSLPVRIKQCTSPSPAHLDTSTLAGCLPPLTQALELFDHFARCMHPTFAVLHIPSTRTLIHDMYQTIAEGGNVDSPGLALLFTIFAGAALAWTTEMLDTLHATHQEAKTAFSTYSTIALHILTNRQHVLPSSTLTLQAISTLCFVLSHSDGSSQDVQTLRIRELLTARGLQIHRLDAPRRREARMLGGENAIELEVQRRLWWHIVSSDW